LFQHVLAGGRRGLGRRGKDGHGREQAASRADETDCHAEDLLKARLSRLGKGSRTFRIGCSRPAVPLHGSAGYRGLAVTVQFCNPTGR
jgi:hypothetical protein